MNPEVSTDKSRLDVSLIHSFLTSSYWAEGRTCDEVCRSIDQSLCFGMYLGDDQVGFARVLSDEVAIAYLLDLFVCEEYQGNGYATTLVEHILNYDSLKSVSWLLATNDAHGLYEKFGFRSVNPERYMRRAKGYALCMESG